MSNRILAILVLLGFGGAIYAFYLYFYVYYKGDLEVRSNIANYQLSLYSDRVRRTFTQNCINDICLLPELPPVDYKITATSSGYLNINTTLTIPKNDIAYLNLDFERKITLESVNNTFIPQFTPEQKVEQFTSRKLYKLIDNESGVYFINKNGATITITSPKGNIGVFDFNGTKRDISIQSIAGNNNTIWLKIGSEHYIYHIAYKQLSSLALNDIKYIKSFGEYGFLIIGNKNMFEYIPHSRSLTQLQDGNDFVRHNDTTIQLSYQKGNSLLIIDENILLTTDQDLVAIYTENDQIYLEDKMGKTYILTGLK